MSRILAKLVEAGSNGVEITCGDGLIWKFYLILATYVTDYPEQCLVACCMENQCSRCVMKPKKCGDYVELLYCDPKTMLELLEEHQRGGDPVKFDQYGICAVYKLFWKNLSHSNIFRSFSLDLLYQLYEGLFKDYLVKWCTAVMGETEVNEWFKAMSLYPGLRHFKFKKGVLFMMQWTGTEHKKIEGVFRCFGRWGEFKSTYHCMTPSYFQNTWKTRKLPENLLWK